MNGNQPGTPRNRNVAKPKQINRIAAPIQVTPQNNASSPGAGAPNPQGVQPIQVQTVPVSNGQNAQVQNPGTPVSSVAMAAQNQSIRGGNAQKQEKKVKEHDPSTMIFVTILLMILAGLAAFIFYVIIPRIEESKNKIEYNDKTTEPIKPATIAPSINSINLNGGVAISSTGTYTVDGVFNIATVDTGNGIDVSINGTKVTTTKKILPTVGRVDDCIVLIVSDGDVRSNRVLVYDKNATMIKDISRFDNAEGMLLLDEDSAYIFSSNMLILMASRVKDTTIILDDNFGSTEGIDMCDEYQLLDNNIDGNFIVIASYALSYQGNNEFKDPYKINDVALQEYRDSNGLCR